PYQELAQSKVGAQEAERRAIAQAVTGRPATPRQEPAKEVQTIASYAVPFFDLYAAAHKPSERRTKRRILDSHILPFFGEMRRDELRQDTIDAFAAAERKRGCSVKTVNNRLGALSSLVRYAVDNGVIPAPSPRLRFKKPGMAAESVAVGREDLEKLLAVAEEPRFRAALLLAAEAGLRAGEILGLQWTDLKDGQLTVRRAIDAVNGEVITPKHDKVRSVPLSSRLAEALDGVPRRGIWIVSRLDGRVLRYAGLVDVMRDLYERAGVTRPPKPLHCLRHAFGTEMAAKGVPLAVLQDLMGHSEIKTTLRYVHVNEQQKRTAIESVFSAAWQPRGSNVVRLDLSSRK